jgi:hypothetical protein
MNEDEKKALMEIYSELDYATVKLREIARRYTWNHMLRNAESLVSVAMDLIEIDLEP